MAVLAQESYPNKIEVRFASDASKQQRGSSLPFATAATNVDAHVRRVS